MAFGSTSKPEVLQRIAYSPGNKLFESYTWMFIIASLGSLLSVFVQEQRRADGFYLERWVVVSFLLMVSTMFLYAVSTGLWHAILTRLGADSLEYTPVAYLHALLNGVYLPLVYLLNATLIPQVDDVVGQQLGMLFGYFGLGVLVGFFAGRALSGFADRRMFGAVALYLGVFGIAVVIVALIFRVAAR